jgi:hypothetical protein
MGVLPVVFAAVLCAGPEWKSQAAQVSDLPGPGASQRESVIDRIRGRFSRQSGPEDAATRMRHESASGRTARWYAADGRVPDGVHSAHGSVAPLSNGPNAACEPQTVRAADASSGVLVLSGVGAAALSSEATGQDGARDADMNSGAEASIEAESITGPALGESVVLPDTQDAGAAGSAAAHAAPWRPAGRSTPPMQCDDPSPIVLVASSPEPLVTPAASVGEPVTLREKPGAIRPTSLVSASPPGGSRMTTADGDPPHDDERAEDDSGSWAAERQPYAAGAIHAVARAGTPWAQAASLGLAALGALLGVVWITRGRMSSAVRAGYGADSAAPQHVATSRVQPDPAGTASYAATVVVAVGLVVAAIGGTLAVEATLQAHNVRPGLLVTALGQVLLIVGICCMGRQRPDALGHPARAARPALVVDPAYVPAPAAFAAPPDARRLAQLKALVFCLSEQLDQL